MSDMYFDPTSFNFDDLTDVIGLNDKPAERVSKEETNGHRDFNGDVSDLFGNTPEPFEEAEQDFNADATDLEQRQQSNALSLSAIDEDTPLDLGGHTMTPREIKELYKAKAKVDNDSAYFAEQANRFDEDNRAIMRQGIMHQTQLEQKINILRNRLSNNAITDADYAQTSRDLQMTETALFQLNQQVNHVMSMRESQQQEVNGYRIRLADDAMVNEFPQWRENKGKVLDYVINQSGVPAVSLEKVYDKGFMTLALKAFMYDQNKKRVAEQAENTKSHAANARSMKGAKVSDRSGNEANKEKASQAFKNLGSSRQANVDAYKYLKD